MEKLYRVLLAETVLPDEQIKGLEGQIVSSEDIKQDGGGILELPNDDGYEERLGPDNQKGIQLHRDMMEVLGKYAVNVIKKEEVIDYEKIVEEYETPSKKTSEVIEWLYEQTGEKVTEKKEIEILNHDEDGLLIRLNREEIQIPAAEVENCYRRPLLMKKILIRTRTLMMGPLPVSSKFFNDNRESEEIGQCIVHDIKKIKGFIKSMGDPVLPIIDLPLTELLEDDKQYILFIRK